PDLPSKTTGEYEAEFGQRMAEAETRAAAEEEQAGRYRAARAARYHPGRAQARLALLGEQGNLSSKIRECDEIISRELFPAVEDDRRDKYLARREAESPPDSAQSMSWPRWWVIRKRCAMSAAGCPPNAGNCP